MAQAYKQQIRDCKHCNGTGKTTISWDDYTMMIIADRLKDLMDAGSINIDELNKRTNIPILKLNDIIDGHMTIDLPELYKLANALECLIVDILPIG